MYSIIAKFQSVFFMKR